MDFILREFDLSDAESIAKYANNEKVGANLRDGFPFPYTMEDAREFIAKTLGAGEESQFVRAIDVNGQAVGSIGIFLAENVYRKGAELGYWLGEPFWRQGIVSRAAVQVCEYAFANYDIVRIYAEPYAYNKASRGVLEKAGFKLEGILEKNVFKRGRIFDSCIYALIRPEFQTEIAPFLETDGRVKNWPSSLELKQKILRYLADKFEPGRDYKEREVNEILKKWHTFGDLFILRRGLVDSGLLKRERDGSRYWRG